MGRMCKDSEETVGHISTECCKLAKIVYKKRHDKAAGAVHWNLCKNYDIQRSKQWYQHLAEPVTVTQNVKIALDINIQTDHMIEHRRPVGPDITVVDKDKQTALLIDVTIAGDARVDEKEQKIASLTH